jgi:photosystem II stability/assembly factor-like uncharacterized protein
MSIFRSSAKASFMLLVSVLVAHATSQSQSWEFLGLKAEPIKSLAVDWSNPDVVFAGSSSDFSLGTVGGIFKTTNGGVTWDTLVRGVTVPDLDIHPVFPNIVYATLAINSLTQPGIIKSTDGGITWAKADSGIEMSWERGPVELEFDRCHPETLYVATAGFGGGGFYKTTDGGSLWRRVGRSTGLPIGVRSIAVNPSRCADVWVGDAVGGIRRSSDGGETWTTTPFEATTGVLSLVIDAEGSMIYAGRAWLSLEHRCFSASADDGLTWQPFLHGLPDSVAVNKILVVKGGSASFLLIACRKFGWGGVFRAGADLTWSQIGIDGSEVWTIAHAKGRLYSGGAGVYVARGAVSVEDPPIPEGRGFTVSNWPNPFNSVTMIEFFLPRNSHVHVGIFDVTGRRVSILEDGSLGPGWHRRDWNALGFSSGAYVARVSTDFGTRTVGILLLR